MKLLPILLLSFLYRISASLSPAFSTAIHCHLHSLPEVDCLRYHADVTLLPDQEENSLPSLRSTTFSSPLPHDQHIYPHGDPITLSIPTQLNQLIVYKLNDALPQILPTGKELLMGDLPRGLHLLVAQVVDEEGRAVTTETTITFQVSKKIFGDE